MKQNPKRFLHLLASGLAITISLQMTACSARPITAPTEIPTIIPDVLPTVTPSPTSVPLDGRGGGVIAFASWQTSDWQITLMNADGSGQTRLQVEGPGGYEPSWSPDGTQIVFQYNGLWIAKLDSGEVTRIPLSVEENDLPNEYIVKPSWSPDGQWIAFLNESGMFGDLYLVHPDGTGLVRLTETNDISRDGNLVWSPDGAQLAYSANRDGNIEIYLLDVVTTTARQLTDTPAPVRNLVTSWSPDGSQLAFSSTRDGNSEIYLMDTDGGNLVRLTNDPFSDAEPDFSPDGSRIVFSSNRDGDIEIYVLTVADAIQDPSAVTVLRLTERKGDEAGPVWSPVP